nr:fibronectin type III domain-containing protein [Prolixibacteraceae bacterium]
MMKNIYHIAILLILVLLVFSGFDATGQNEVIIRNGDYDNTDTWGTGPGVADFRASANASSGAVCAFAAAYVGASAAESTVKIWVENNETEYPVWMKVEAEILHKGTTYTGDFAAFAGTRVSYGANGKRYYNDIEAGLDWSVAVDKFLSLAELATTYVPMPSSFTYVQKVMDMIRKVNDIYGYTDYYNTLKNIIEGETEKITFEFKAVPGINEISLGVRADAAAFLTSSGFALIFAQVRNVKITKHGAEGHWYPADDSYKWVEHDNNRDGKINDVFDHGLKDFKDNEHPGYYHPYSVTSSNDYRGRHPETMYTSTHHLSLNQEGYSDEYFVFDFEPSERNALSTEGTFEAWVNPRHSGTFTGHILHASYDNDGDPYGADGWGSEDEIHLSCNETGAYSFYIGGNGRTVSIHSGDLHYNPSADEFNHVLGTWYNKNNQLKAFLYVDGNMVASDSIALSAAISLNTFLLGKPAKDDRCFHGKFHDIKIRQTMLTPTEVQLAYWQSGGDTDNPSLPVVNDLPEFSPSTANMITWEPSTDPTSYVDYYLIECKNVNTSNYRHDTVYSTSYLDTSLTNGISYQYRVKARDVAGHWSAYSAAISTTIDTTPPMQPVIDYIPVYTAGNSVNLNWTSAGADSFMVYFSSSENFTGGSEILDSTEWIRPDSVELTGLQLDLSTLPYNGDSDPHSE